MARARTTRDTFELWTNYGNGNGWEHETTEWTRHAAREQVACYAANTPSTATKIILQRVKLATMTADERTEAAQADADALAARRARTAARLARRQPRTQEPT